ncbi:hypothetical protein J7E63_12405 [Bacillus sp. ISL-75]|uniref:hypothetical protein n=1 Tax=Bacillus sp. ISL-75 TaxID=2819137 RepID=UPI001BE60CB3|nr:hypothetical protein [Bacillus sp. ISL-75]MBT2727738.1 hypothetical protein [Bacillus sp. ISL-75]
MDKEKMLQQFKEYGSTSQIIEKKHGATPQSVEKNNNGSMAQNLDEIKKLGKEMNQMKTGSQQQENENLIPDPIQ